MNMHTPGRRSLFWAYAAAFGALWGALEVTVGTFLHTLRLPFAGALLASMGAAILIAQRQILPRRGLALATGVVAALCKSVSPGGIIVGPMIGILAEALLAEAALFCFPSPVSAVVAGGLSAIWAVLQKLVFQFLFYGATVLELYSALLTKASDWLALPPSSGWYALGCFLGLLFSGGGLVGALGSRIGSRARESLAAGVPVV